MSFSALRSWPVSSVEVTSISLLRSPAATVRATATAWFSGLMIERLISQATSTAATSEKPPTPSISAMAWV